MATHTPATPVWFKLAAFASAAVLVCLLVDRFGDPAGTTRTVLQAVALGGAAIAAGTFYQHWSTVPVRLVPHHVMAGLGLLGGALVASSAVSADAGVFGNAITASRGAAALLVATAAASSTLPQRSAPRPKDRR